MTNTNPTDDYLEAVEAAMVRKGVPEEERRSILQDLAHQIDALRAEMGSDVTDEDLIARLDPPESFAEREEDASPPVADVHDQPTGKGLKKIIVGGVLVVVLLGLIGGAVAASSYAIRLRNEAVVRQEQIAASWAQVENQLQRRMDLIPNLVQTVKGYATHDKEIFTQVATLRSQWAEADTVQDKQAVGQDATNLLGRLMAVAEAYPNLRASENFAMLQVQLEGTENRLAIERRRYNESIRSYNTWIRIFPVSLLGFEPVDTYFEAEAAATKTPEVQF